MFPTSPFAYYRESCLLIGAQLRLDEAVDAEIMRGPRNAFHGFTMWELGARHIWTSV